MDNMVSNISNYVNIDLIIFIYNYAFILQINENRGGMFEIKVTHQR
jgi:hypothetical protein